MTTGATMGGRRVGVALAIVALLVNLSGCGDRAVPPDQQVRPKLPMALSAHASAQRSPLATAGEAASPVPPDHPVEYRLAPGVEAPARSAAAYRLLPEEVDRQRVARLARALGLEAGVQGPDHGIFTVVSGTTRLVVEDGRWEYVRDAGTTPSEPPVDAPCQPGEECPPPPEPAALVSIPSASEAEDKAREFLSDAGIDVQGADTVIGEEATFRRTVTFVPQAGGRRVLGLQTSLTFGDHALVEQGSGFFGHFQSVGEYPLIGLEEALDRYRSASAGAGMAGPAQAEVVELTAVELVLEAVQPFCPGDTVYLVPTFAFDPDGVVVVPAVAGEELVGPDQPAEPTPAPCRGNEAVTVPPAGFPEPAPQPWTPER